MSLRRRTRQILVELVGAITYRLARLAARVGFGSSPILVDATSGTHAGVCFTPQRAAVPIPPVDAVHVDERSPSTRDYRDRFATWSTPQTLPAGMVTAHDVDVSMPTGIHRWRNRVFREGLLGGEALHNPKYLAAFLAMMFVGSAEVAEGVLLGLPWNHNIYHWLVEILPRMQLTEELPALQQVPLLVPASAPAFVPDSLRLAGLEPQVKALDDGVHRVRTLHLPTRLARTADVSPDALRWLDEKFPMAAPAGRRLYISRGDAPIRYVSNERDVRQMLEQDFGFETLVMSTIAFDEQVRAFREADVVVGAHGAAFAHLAFAPRGAAFLEIFRSGHFNPCYGRMCAIRGIDYGFLVGAPDALGLRVDLASLRSVVDRMVRERPEPARTTAVTAPDR